MIVFQNHEGVQKPVMSSREAVSSEEFCAQRDKCVETFQGWSDQQQVDFVQTLLHCMNQIQHGQIDQHLQPLLQRDFISALPGRFSLSVVERNALMCLLKWVVT